MVSKSRSLKHYPLQERLSLWISIGRIVLFGGTITYKVCNGFFRASTPLVTPEWPSATNSKEADEKFAPEGK